LAIPRNSSDKMTPELPRAPRSSALAAQSATAPTVSVCLRPSSMAAEFIVRLMFVPVSPSGTGKTLSSLIFCLFSSSAAFAHRSISRSAAASMISLKSVHLRQGE